MIAECSQFRRQSICCYDRYHFCIKFSRPKITFVILNIIINFCCYLSVFNIIVKMTNNTQNTENRLACTVTLVSKRVDHSLTECLKSDKLENQTSGRKIFF